MNLSRSNLPVLFVLFVRAATAGATTPAGTAFTYQGQLKQAGQPLNGAADLVFTLYDASSAGNVVGTQTLNGVAVSAGLFTIQLNGAGEFGASAFNGDKRWLEISVNGTPMTPRQELTAAPYALGVHLPLFETTSITTVNGSVFQIRNLATTGTTYAITGSTESTSGRGVQGNAGATSGVTRGVYGLSFSPDGFGVYGSNAATGVGPAYGVYGQSASGIGVTGEGGFTGVLGLASATSGSSYGGEFHSASVEGGGVFGESTATFGNAAGVVGYTDSSDGFGVAGTAVSNTGQAIGVAGVTNSPAGCGLRGEAFAASGTTYGAFGHSFSSSGIGAYGLASAASGTNYGGYFESDSTNGRGVYGVVTATSGVTLGVNGESSSASGVGVRGFASATSGTIYGVYGRASTAAGYGVYAQGDMGASGTKSFRIDHPLDPQNKYLLHYSVESPEVLNAYSGKVTLDARGEAVVELPAYFASINKDPRYTLTAMGAPMPNLHVAEEISDEALQAGEQAGLGVAPPTCSFRIAGGVAGGRVSWRVEALRNDLRMRMHDAPVERQKTGTERGKYQHPELYGQPPELSMDFDAGHARPLPAASPEETPR